MTRTDSAIKTLEGRIGHLRCDEVRDLLLDLKFQVKDGANGKHRVVTHSGLSKVAEFRSTSYDCGHGRNPEIKRPYIKNLVKVLEMYKEYLDELLEAGNG